MKNLLVSFILSFSGFVAFASPEQELKDKVAAKSFAKHYLRLDEFIKEYKDQEERKILFYEKQCECMRDAYEVSILSKNAIEKIAEIDSRIAALPKSSNTISQIVFENERKSLGCELIAADLVEKVSYIKEVLRQVQIMKTLCQELLFMDIEDIRQDENYKYFFELENIWQEKKSSIVLKSNVHTWLPELISVIFF
jgi:hypothetical protein